MEHGQLCPLAKATEILAERWTFLVIRQLLSGAARFNEIRRGVPLMSPSLLSERLRRLQREGLVRRDIADSGHLYRLTEAGRELAPIVNGLSRWGERWVLGHIDPRKPDVTNLMWAMWRRVDASVFRQGRVTVQFEFTDQPRSKRFWWLVNEGTDVDLCPKDPGFDVDLYVLTDLETMAQVWVGRLQLATAIEAGRLECSGAHDLRRALRSWLLLSPFAQSHAVEPGDRPAGPGIRSRHRHNGVAHKQPSPDATG